MCSFVGLPALALFVASCGGGEFRADPTPGSLADGGPKGDAKIAGDAGDAADTCEVLPGQQGGTFCIRIEADAKHPAYDANAEHAYQIDGKGRLKVYLFDQNPGDTDAVPKATIEYPREVGVEMDVKQFPVTVKGIAKAGPYWIVAVFEDKVAARPQILAYQVGDYVTTPSFDARLAAIFPQVILREGEAQTQTLHLRTVRRIDLTFQAAYLPTERSNPQFPWIWGNGPALALLHDGTADKGTFLDVAIISCADLNAKDANSAPFRTSAMTTIDGAHKLIALLYDYDQSFNKDVPPGTSISKDADLVIDANKWANGPFDVPFTTFTRWPDTPPNVDQKTAKSCVPEP